MRRRVQPLVSVEPVAQAPDRVNRPLVRWPDQCRQFNSPDSDSGRDLITEHGHLLTANAAPYYKWIADAITPFVGRRALEMGAGMGMLTREMPRLELLIASDTWLPYLDTLRTLGRPDIAVMQIDVRGLAPRTQEIRSLALDAVYSSNLLEHLEDDVDALRHMRRVVREDGRVVAFVPALRKLYGRHDQAVGHYRRYERRELKEKMQAAGLAVERLRYFNLPGVLAWSIINRRSGQVRSADLRFFSKFIPLFRTLERLLPPPVGLSLIAVGRNVEDPSRPSLSSPW